MRPEDDAALDAAVVAWVELEQDYDDWQAKNLSGTSDGPDLKVAALRELTDEALDEGERLWNAAAAARRAYHDLRRRLGELGFPPIA